jgi:hypothetical protein
MQVMSAARQFRKGAHAGNEVKLSTAVLRKLPAITWPNDCPDCGARMEFDFTPDETAFRRCPCGTAVRVEKGELVRNQKPETRNLKPSPPRRTVSTLGLLAALTISDAA